MRAMKSLPRRLCLALLLLVLSATSAWSLDLKVASFNMERLGQNHKDYPALAKVVSSFDVVAAEEVMNKRGMGRVAEQLPAGWSYLISRTSEGSKRYREYYGFFYDSRLEVVKVLGEYPNTHQFFRPPYGVRFRVKTTGFEFNLIASHIIYGHSNAHRLREINNLGRVYQYFESQTGNAGSTIMAGDFNEERLADFSSLIDLGDREVIPVKGSTIGKRGPDHGYDHMFVGPAIAPLVQSADVDYWTSEFEWSRKNVSDHFPVYMVLKIAP